MDNQAPFPASVPRRRRFSFSLRGLFVGVAVVAGLSWVANNLRWIHERRQLMEFPPTRYLHAEGWIDAPWQLKMLGEKGYSDISISFTPWSEWKTAKLTPAQAAHLDRVQRLFPEARVSTIPLDSHGPYGMSPLPKPARAMD